MSNGNHIGNSNDMVVGDNDHGDAVSKCGSCGVAWVDHLGILGVCAENAKLRTERDEAREIAKKYENRYFGAVIQRNAARRDFLREYWMKDDTDDEPLAKEDAVKRGWDCFKEEGTP